MVESIKIVLFGGFLLAAGVAITVKPTLGEWNIGHERIERILGRIFGILGIAFGGGLVYLGL